MNQTTHPILENEGISEEKENINEQPQQTNSTNNYYKYVECSKLDPNRDIGKVSTAPGSNFY